MRRALFTLAVAGMLVVVGGCGSKSSTAASSVTTTTGASASSTTTAGGARKCSVRPVTSYPTAAQSYADATLDAWLRCDGAAIGEYATPEVAAFLRNDGPMPGETFTFAGCHPAAVGTQFEGQPECTYSSSQGKSRDFKVTLSPSHLGQPHAVVG